MQIHKLAKFISETPPEDYRDLKVEKIKQAKKRISKVKKEIRKKGEERIIADDSIKPEIKIECGDFRKRIKKIPDNSIDLVLTDPPYPKEYLPLWIDLAKESLRVLKPSGFLISYSGDYYLPEILTMLSKYLNYYCLGALYHKGRIGQDFQRHMFNRAKPILFFYKPPFKKQEKWLQNVVVSEKANKEFHKWGQSVEPFVKLIECFSKPLDTVLDPCLGGGSVLEAAIKTKRNFIGYEIDRKVFNELNQRIFENGR